MPTRSAHPLGSNALTLIGGVGKLPDVPADAPPIVEPDSGAACTCRPPFKRPPALISGWDAGCTACHRPRDVGCSFARANQAGYRR